MATSIPTNKPKLSAPLTTDNSNNHSGLIVIITSVLICVSILALFARGIYSYYKKSTRRDDYMFAGLISFVFIQASLVYAQVHYGWGTRAANTYTAKSEPMLKLGYAADIFFILITGFSKMTTCLFYENLFPQHQKIRYVLIGVSAWSLLSLLLVSIRCTSHPWHDISVRNCSGLLPRYLFITVTDVLSEIALLVYTVFAIKTISITMKQKIIVFCALQSRILNVPCAIVHLYFLTLQINSQNPTLIGAFATTTTEIYLTFNVITILTAFLKSFIAAYEDDTGISYTHRMPLYSSSSVSNSGNIKSASRRQRVDEDDDQDPIMCELHNYRSKKSSTR